MQENNLVFLWIKQIIIWILWLPFYLLLWILLKSIQLVVFFCVLFSAESFTIAADESDLFKRRKLKSLFSNFLEKELNDRKKYKLIIGAHLAHDISIILKLGTVLTSGDGISLCLAMRYCDSRFELGWFEDEKWKSDSPILFSKEENLFIEWLAKQSGKSFQKLEKVRDSFSAQRLKIACVQCAQNDVVTYGFQLAQLVSEHLMNVQNICYRHRDYCGMGLAYHDNHFIYDMVIDGQFGFEDPEVNRPLVEDGQIFESSIKFVDWLAQQNDESLSGRASGDSWITNNQRITRQRLLEEISNNLK